MLLASLNSEELQAPLAVVGLVFASAGAILWFGSFAVVETQRERVRQFATGLGILSPILLAWPLLIEIGAVALWVLLGFFGLMLFVVLLMSLLSLYLIDGQKHEQPSDKDSRDDKGDTVQRVREVESRKESHSIRVGRAEKRQSAFLLSIGFATGAITVWRLLRRKA